MVYCGKPSKGCQMCRTRRIKCDETKPTCNQCTKARRQCPGYKDEFDLVLRDENLAAKRRALKLTTPRRKSSANTGASASTTNSKKPSKPSPAPTSSSSSSSSSSSFSPSPTPTTPLSRTSTSPQPLSPFNKDKNNNRNLHLLPAHHQTLALFPTPLHLPPEDLAPCHFVANFVLLPRQDGTRGFLDYLLPLMQHDAASKTEDLSHLQHAFNACALASLGNRTGPDSSGRATPGAGAGGVGSWAWAGAGAGAGDGRGGAGGGRTGCLGKAFGEYSRALRATQAALVDPQRWKSDGVLAAVLLLGMFENITAKQLGSLAWGSHVEGAIQLVKARGRSQLKTKLGMQLFIAVRTQLIIHTLTSGTPPPMGADWWIQDAVADSTAAEHQRLSLKAGELRAEVTRVMTTAERTPETIQLVQSLMHRAQNLDQQMAAWMASVPEAWQYRTLCWQAHNLAVPGGGSDYSKAEVFPGRVDVYNDFWVAAVWNLARTTRLVLNSIAVRCAAWVCSPVDYRTTPQYATAARVCVDTISDIISSVPYHFGWHTKRSELFPSDEATNFGCGDEYGMKGLAGYFLSWPLACMMTQDYSTDAQRSYIRGRLKHIGDELGIKYAHILLQLQFRMPSMLIRSDGLLAKPYPMAHNFEKLLSSSRLPCPLSKGYTLGNPAQRADVPQEQPPQSQGGPAGASGEATQPVMQKWVSV